MKTNGFNFVRLRTFVDPKASDGYDKTSGYDDITHTVAFGKLVKDAGMGLLIDFHMSDNWADPGKQCMPVAWQGYTNIADLSTALHDYVKSSITALIAGGARPDMVQIGNETTPGMLLHICDSGGQVITGMTPKVTGAASTTGWPNLGMLLKAGIQGVKDVDTGILISFHIDRGSTYSTSKNWIDNAINQGANMDAFGESCYQQYQGDKNSQATTQSGWQTTFSQLATNYPKIRFFAAEYGPMERQINDVVFGLPNNQGLGTFDWEPTTPRGLEQRAAVRLLDDHPRALAAVGEQLHRPARPRALPADEDRLRQPTLRPGETVPAKHEREVVRRHGDHLGRSEAGPSSERLNVAEIAHAPADILAAQPLVEARVALGRVLAIALERTVKEKHTGRWQQARRPAKQRLGRRPGGDVDHVDVQDRVGVGNRPRRELDVELQWGRDVVRAGGDGPGADAVEVHGRRVRRLPAQGGQLAREERHVLPRPAGDLQHQACRRQDATENLEDRPAVPLGGGRVQPAGGSGRWIEERHADVILSFLFPAAARGPRG